jgi:segregation and condensation protein A
VVEMPDLGDAALELAGGPAVVLGAGRLPEQTTRIRLAMFEGPLGLLLSLIEARQLDVLTVPLGLLAAAYLDALATLDADRMGSVSAFVAVASQLILIKSRAMLPRPAGPIASAADEAPDPEAELRARLILYRAYRDAGVALRAIALERVGMFRREPAVAVAAGRAGAVSAPEPPMDVEVLARSLDGLLRVVPPPLMPSEALPRTVTIGERAAVIWAALRMTDTVVLQELLRGVRDRIVVVLTFLAMLELMKRREIVVEQAEPWGPIVARASTAQERSAWGVPVASDEPLDETLESFA